MKNVCLFFLMFISFQSLCAQDKWIGLLDFKTYAKNYIDIAGMSISICSGDKLVNRVDFVPMHYDFDEHENQSAYYTLYLHSGFMKQNLSWLKRKDWLYKLVDLKHYQQEKSLTGFLHRGHIECNKPDGKQMVIQDLKKYRSIEIAYRQPIALDSTLENKNSL